jgi:hypothetical protein
VKWEGFTRLHKNHLLQLVSLRERNLYLKDGYEEDLIGSSSQVEMRMEAICLFETAVTTFASTHGHNLENRSRNVYCREDHRSQDTS